jgi:metal-sulfur cluster biosynthetic enzyme
MTLINANPTVYAVQTNIRTLSPNDWDDDVADVFDAQEIYGTPSYTISLIVDLIRTIQDPEHPMTLEQLHVVQLAHIVMDDAQSVVRVDFTPTIPHCSMATLIGLCIRVRLLQCLPRRFKVDIYVRKGTHQSEDAVNKQLNDKERVAAALENKNLLGVVNQCLQRAVQEASR